jgi:hypothetical protein
MVTAECKFDARPVAHSHLATGHQWKVTTSDIEGVCLFHVQGLPSDRATLPSLSRP